MLVDTGSTVSLLNSHSLTPLMLAAIATSVIAVRSVTSSPLDVVGTLSCVVEIDGTTFPDQFIVARNLCTTAILGTDFLHKNSAIIDFSSPTPLNFRPLPSVGPARATVRKQMTIPACHATFVPVDCSNTFAAGDCLISELSAFAQKHPELDVSTGVVNASQKDIVLLVANTHDKDVILYEGTNISELSPLHADVVVGVTEAECAACSEEECSAMSCDEPASKEDELRSYVARQDHLSKKDTAKLLELLLEYQDGFLVADDTLGRCTVYPHTINTGDAVPIKQAARCLPFHRRVDLQSLLADMLQQGIITESNSPWAAPIVLVKKKDGSTRLCVDYRKLNKVTVPDAYPLPRVDDTLDSLNGCKLFSTMDLASGYWQLAMAENDREKSAFATPIGLYEFTVLPMGVCNGPATFQRAMEKVLGNLLLTSSAPLCRVFFDDVNVASIGAGDHFNMLSKVFGRLRQAKLKLKLKKCHFLHPEVDFLGYRVSAAGISTCPKKVDKVRNWPTPKNATEVKSFLGLASYYCKFIKNFSKVAAPLHGLTAKNFKFEWTKSCPAAFRILKERLTSAPILAFPDFSSDASAFTLDTDASNCGMGAVLSQNQNGELRVIAYASKVFNKSQRNYHAYDRELLACVTFIEQFRHYLVAKKFQLRTDHEALKSLFSSLDPRGRRARWIEKLSDYDFEIVHRPGLKHGNADALSRMPTCDPSIQGTETVAAIPIPANPQTNFSWMDGCIFLDLHLFSLTQHNS